MGIPEEYRRGFELGKYYAHNGGTKMHIIAETNFSDMYHIDPGGIMLVGEDRAGGLQPIDGNLHGACNYYEISAQIFIEDLKPEEYKFGNIRRQDKDTDYKILDLPRFFLYLYRNNELYLFDFLDYYNEDGLQINIIKEDVNGIFAEFNKHVKPEEMALVEKLIFERI